MEAKIESCLKELGETAEPDFTPEILALLEGDKGVISHFKARGRAYVRRSPIRTAVTTEGERIAYCVYDVPFIEEASDGTTALYLEILGELKIVNVRMSFKEALEEFRRARSHTYPLEDYLND